MAIEKLEENEPKASGEKKVSNVIFIFSLGIYAKFLQTPNTKNSQNKEEAEEIITRSGSVRGKTVTSEEGFSHFEYLGIPYAQPPIGELRFQNPIPVKPWIETLDATKAGPVCYQKGNFGFGLGEMSEDCLTLNIYTQDKNLDSKPVMIWIHGGGFTEGSGSQYIPVKLIREGVIVVTLNYRLGSLGFLTFGNNLVSGNMGLKDQQLAIRWVKQNIERFGGDPEQITLFGESAGGISVHAHVLSPWNYGLIKGAIAQSGTMLIYSNSRQNEERFARTAADRLGCENDDLGEETLRCLQAVDIDQLNNDLDPRNANFNKIKGPAPFEWRPVIDKYSSNPFLPLESLEALKTGTFNRVPFMSGTVKNEGALMFGILRGAGWSRANLTEFWKYVGPSLILQSPSVGDYTPQERDMATISLKYYNHPVEETSVGLDQPWMDLMGDAAFLSPDQKSVGLMSQYSPAVFNYYFTQQVATSLLAQLFKLGQEYTPVHADDIAFLFDFIVQNMTISSSDGDKKLSSKMVKYWTNFAKYGHPTPSSDDDLTTWIPATTTDKV